MTQVHNKGRLQMLMEEIIDHCILDDAFPIGSVTYLTPSGTSRKLRTTKGWELYVQWKDGSTNWVALKDLKDSYPVKLANYALVENLSQEPVFAWWVPRVNRKRQRIIQK